jgi:hypothetical protein
MGVMDGFGLAPAPRARKWAEPPAKADRALDEKVLRALRMRHFMNAPQVAEILGQSPEWVRRETADVVAHDYATPDLSTGANAGEAIGPAYDFVKKARKA